MSKELDALEFICKILSEKSIDLKWLFKEQYNTIKQALQELQAIKNSKPSDAMKCLEKKIIWTYDLNIIKQALLKAQEQEKVLKIIFEKTVNILLLELAENVDEYNERIVPNGQLTQEEFKSLRRYFKQ